MCNVASSPTSYKVYWWWAWDCLLWTMPLLDVPDADVPEGSIHTPDCVKQPEGVVASSCMSSGIASVRSGIWLTASLRVQESASATFG